MVVPTNTVLKITREKTVLFEIEMNSARQLPMVSWMLNMSTVNRENQVRVAVSLRSSLSKKLKLLFKKTPG